MKELLVGMGIGFVVGAMVVKSNKQLSQAVDKGKKVVEDAIDQGMQMVEDKMNSAKKKANTTAKAGK